MGERSKLRYRLHRFRCGYSLLFFIPNTTPTISSKMSTNIETFNPYLSKTINIEVNTSLILLQKGWATRRLRQMWLSYVRYVDGTVWEIPMDMRICLTWYVNLRLNPFLWSDSFLRRFFTYLVRHESLDFSGEHLI